MQPELQALEAQLKGLQLLVHELLLTNQELRTELAKQGKTLSASATHPQPRQDH
jgi:hypothetical protein